MTSYETHQILMVKKISFKKSVALPWDCRGSSQNERLVWKMYFHLFLKKNKTPVFLHFSDLLFSSEKFIRCLLQKLVKAVLVFFSKNVSLVYFNSNTIVTS